MDEWTVKVGQFGPSALILIVGLFLWSEIEGVKEDLSKLSERVARIEGLLEGQKIALKK